MKTLIGIAGRKRAGKDTVAAHLVERFGYEQRSFAALLKRMALAVDPIVDIGFDSRVIYRLSQVVDEEGWEGAKEYGEVRRFLQTLGTDGVRGHLGEDAWVDAALPSAPTSRTVFADVRFPNEAQRILDCGGQLLRIVRPGQSKVDLHSSETALCDWDIPVVVNDGSIEQLCRRAEWVLTYSSKWI